MNVLDDMCSLTDAKPTGQDKYLGHCLAHGSKRHRDLSIRVAGNKILLHCFAGCRLPAICQSLGIEQRDLFFDALDSNPSQRREAMQQRDRQRQERDQHARQQGALIDALREADYFVRSRQGLDISGWSDERVDNELSALADAYALLESEERHG